MLRNDQVFLLYQGNRNPFVDHPEWAESICGDSALRLSASKSGDGLRLTWSAAFVDATLEARPGFSQSWTPFAAEARTTNGQWLVLAPLNSGASFFRLRLP
jgi:hypothetical protein